MVQAAYTQSRPTEYSFVVRLAQGTRSRAEKRHMDILVIYDSTYGNTKEIAQAIADALAEAASVRLLRANKVQPSDLQGVDLLVLGCPTHRQRPTSAIQAFLESIPATSLSEISAAAFDTRYHKPRLLTGSAARRVAKHLRKAGASVEVPAQSFFVVSREGPLEEGELERAAAWARQILDKLETT
jgi:flavodoxin I